MIRKFKKIIGAWIYGRVAGGLQCERAQGVENRDAWVVRSCIGILVASRINERSGMSGYISRKECCNRIIENRQFVEELVDRDRTIDLLISARITVWRARCQK